MYTNAQYVNGFNGVAVNIRCDIYGVSSLVPINDSNTDYQNIMLLVAAGKLAIAPAA